MFVVAVNWLVSRLNSSFTCRLAEEHNVLVSNRRKLLMLLSSAEMHPLEKGDFSYRLNDIETTLWCSGKAAKCIDCDSVC